MYEEIKLVANGLELVSLKSTADSHDSLDQSKLFTSLTENFKKQAFVVAWLDNCVRIGLWQGKDFEFYGAEKLDLKYVQRLRVFDLEQELHVWRTNSAWKGRLRIDGRGEDAEAVVAHQLLYGTKGERLTARFALIEEDRGTMLVLPLSSVQFSDEGILKERIFIKTHNYIRSNAVLQATYFDCRFVAFTNGKVELA